jgi:hypothetical protein
MKRWVEVVVGGCGDTGGGEHSLCMNRTLYAMCLCMGGEEGAGVAADGTRPQPRRCKWHSQQREPLHVIVL